MTFKEFLKNVKISDYLDPEMVRFIIAVTSDDDFPEIFNSANALVEHLEKLSFDQSMIDCAKRAWGRYECQEQRNKTEQSIATT